MFFDYIDLLYEQVISLFSSAFKFTFLLSPFVIIIVFIAQFFRFNRG